MRAVHGLSENILKSEQDLRSDLDAAPGAHCAQILKMLCLGQALPETFELARIGLRAAASRKL